MMNRALLVESKMMGLWGGCRKGRRSCPQLRGAAHLLPFPLSLFGSLYPSVGLAPYHRSRPSLIPPSFQLLQKCPCGLPQGGVGKSAVWCPSLAAQQDIVAAEVVSCAINRHREKTNPKDCSPGDEGGGTDARPKGSHDPLLSSCDTISQGLLGSPPSLVAMRRGRRHRALYV